MVYAIINGEHYHQANGKGRLCRTHKKKEDDGRERKIKLTEKGIEYSKDILKDIYLAEDKAYKNLKNPKELIEEYERLVSETKKAIKEIDNND